MESYRDKFYRNPTIDPITNVKIDIGSKRYHELAKEYGYPKIKSPKTNRTVDIGKPAYNKLLSEYTHDYLLTQTISDNLQAIPENNLVSLDNSILNNILNFEHTHHDQFLRPLSAFHKATSNRDGTDDIRKLRCLALCHGHNHSYKILSTIKGNCFWYMADKKKDAYPDYVCDISNEMDMSIFPDNYFDIIINVFCPLIGDINKNHSNILNNASRMIKPDGKIYLTELPDLFYKLLNKHDYLALIKIVDNNVDQQAFEHYKAEYMKKFPKRKDVNQNVIYDELIYGKNIKNDKVSNIIRDKSMKFTMSYLKSHGLYVIDDTKPSYIIVGKN